MSLVPWLKAMAERPACHWQEPERDSPGFWEVKVSQILDRVPISWDDAGSRHSFLTLFLLQKLATGRLRPHLRRRPSLVRPLDCRTLPVAVPIFTVGIRQVRCAGGRHSGPEGRRLRVKSVFALLVKSKCRPLAKRQSFRFALQTDVSLINWKSLL